jgi:hypothetical protein
MVEILAYIFLFLSIVLFGFVVVSFFKLKEFEQEPKEWKNLPKSLRVNLWIGLHYKKFLITMFLMPLILLGAVFYLYYLKENEIAYVSKSLENLSNKAILLYPNGQIAELYLSELKPQAVQSFLDDVVVNYLIWGKLCLFKNGNFPTDFTQIPNYCYKVDAFIKSGLLTKEGLRYYAQALKGIYALAKLDKLPEIIKPEQINSKISVRKEDGKLYFDYTADVTTYIEYVKIGQQQTFYGKGDYKVEMQGVIDPERGNLKNPFGVEISYILLTPPTKP